MVVHRKNKQRKSFLMTKSTHFVVANTLKHALEIYNNESRSELVYLLSLADAVLSFESDNANIVMEKCFCVEVRTWKKKNTVRLQPQGFIFYEENQARMLLWVKCIHLAIKRATTLDSELFRSPSTASSIEHSRCFSDTDESLANVGEDTPGTSPASTYISTRDKLTHRLVIDPATRFVSAGRTMLTPNRSPSVTGERHPTRWSSMFSYEKQQQTRSPMSSTATDPGSSPVETSVLSPKLSGWGKRSTKATPDVSPETPSRQHVDHAPSSRSRPFRSRTPVGTPKNDPVTVVPPAKTSTLSEKLDEVKSPEILTAPEENNGSLPTDSKHENISTELVDDPKPASLRALTIMLTVAIVAGASDVSVFLPIALAGAFAHLCNQHHCFSSWTIASVLVYLISSYEVLFGIGISTIVLYLWGYANYKTDRRRRMKQQGIVHLRGTKSSQEIAHFEIPNWLLYPDTDRVEWLNKVFVTGWPYLKKAIENSVLSSLNPVLDTQKPAFMNSLSIVRLDLGNNTPQIASVKYISANTLTDEVTLDVEIRILTDRKSFVAELRMVSHVGAAVCLSLRELLLVGTLRITLNPLTKFWPCFGGLNLSFTQRPVFDFSLTAAKINIANVPFVSEWLHTFLYDLLINYFVWPNVLNIPLWDEHGNPVQ
ncbi:hypothetical protein PHMEG_0006568 [Phytophthora megakarya]|uniref:SMP-LTD domain-containing protein n=1 Tax=Phytophthora megakarya TaxID=4795 RepID=A0A225WNU2_9STRA|nr:hypothetical protein PHMEG_0006568 [Phytophthora megakarya]